MSELKICRICLRTEAKVYNYEQFQLKSYYEEVLALKVSEADELPHYFCFECATLLHKFHKFKEKCFSGQRVLRDMLRKGPISYEAIYKLDKTNLQSPLAKLELKYNVLKIFSTEDDLPIKEEIAQHDQRLTKIENIEIACVYEPGIDQYDDVFPGSDADSDSDPKCPTVQEKTSHDIEAVKIEVEDENASDGKDKDVYTLKRSRLLNSKHWGKKKLSEEEAIEEFRQRAENEKYMVAAYKCTDCFKGFSKEDMLKRHRKLTHNKSGSVECRFCRMRFKWNCHLKKHMRQHYIRYECLRCGLVCPLENTALLHDIYHSGFTKKCVHCDEEFRHFSTYYTHLRTHRSEHLCTHCGSSFVSEMGLHMHKRVKHCFNTVNDEGENEIESPGDDEEVNTFCTRCDIRFETRKAYDEHLFHSAMHSEGYDEEKKHEDPLPRKILGKVLKAKITSRLRDKKRSNEDIFQPQKKKFRRIRRAKTKPTTCHHCGKHFDTQAACMKHHLTDHPRTSFFAPNERHICEICGASLAPGSVTAHQNMHTRERLHPCETCGKQFHSSVGLKRHAVTHTGEKPYGCTLCDKRFTQNNSMKLHYRTFHLMQPYPKRNRRLKKEELNVNISKTVEESVDSDDNIPLSKSATKTSATVIEPMPLPVNNTTETTVQVAQNSDNNLDYLTLGYQKYP